MSRRNEGLVRDRAAIREAARRSKDRSIALVGSTARREDLDRSDYDFRVGFENDADLVDVAGLQVELQELLGGEVDVIDSASIKRESHLAMLMDAIPL